MASRCSFRIGARPSIWFTQNVACIQIYNWRKLQMKRISIYSFLGNIATCNIAKTCHFEKRWNREILIEKKLIFDWFTVVRHLLFAYATHFTLLLPAHWHTQFVSVLWVFFNQTFSIPELQNIVSFTVDWIFVFISEKKFEYCWWICFLPPELTAFLTCNRTATMISIKVEMSGNFCRYYFVLGFTPVYFEKLHFGENVVCVCVVNFSMPYMA